MKPPPARARRDCQHPKAKHEHGTYLGYLSDGCRCLPCTAAWVRKSTERRRIVQAKSWGQPDVRTTIFEPVAATSLRLRALAVLGYGCPELSKRYGVSASVLAEARRGVFPAVRRSTALAVARMYDDLWDTRSTNPRAGQTISRATKYGWLPPLALDDDAIDRGMTTDLHTNSSASRRRGIPSYVDEIAVERAMRGDPVRLTKAERSEAWARLEAMGLTAREIAERLHVTERTITRNRSAAA